MIKALENRYLLYRERRGVFRGFILVQETKRENLLPKRLLWYQHRMSMPYFVVECVLQVFHVSRSIHEGEEG